MSCHGRALASPFTCKKGVSRLARSRALLNFSGGCIRSECWRGSGSGGRTVGSAARRVALRGTRGRYAAGVVMPVRVELNLRRRRESASPRMRLPSAASHARHAPDDVEDQAGDGDVLPHPYYKPTWAVVTQPPGAGGGRDTGRWKEPRYRETERTMTLRD